MPMLHFDLDELFENLIPEEKSKKQNSTDTEHKDKFRRVGREVLQAQQPHGFATPLNNSTESTISTKWLENPSLEEYLNDLTAEAQIDSLIDIPHFKPGGDSGAFLDQPPQIDFIPAPQNNSYKRSILWLENEIETAWRNRTPVVIEIPEDCVVEPTLIVDRTKQRLERYWTARPHTGSLMSACLLASVGSRLLLYRVPQDIQLLNFTLPMPEMAKFYSPQEQQLLDSVQRFADHCRAGEIWEILEHWIPDAVELAKDVDFMVEKRTSELGVWKNENTLVCGPRSHF